MVETILKGLRCLLLAAGVIFGTMTASGATFTVTNLNDDGPGSFRQALRDADGDDTITFAVTGTIVVKNLPLQTDASNLTIAGPGADRLSISGDGRSRVFVVKADGIVTMSGLTIRDGNSTIGLGAQPRGAGIYNYGELTLNDCVITNNEGGGIDSPGLIYINRCTIARNTATSGLFGQYELVARAAGLVAGADGIITHSTIVDNEATNDERAEPRNSVLAGGIATYNTLKVIGCTISGNRIDGATDAPTAGGIANLSIEYSPLITDSIVAGNTSPAAADCSGVMRSGGYNLIGDKAGSTGFEHGVKHDQVGGVGRAVIDPRLAPLANNGGPTPTMALLAGSPAIDAGLSLLAIDQRGTPRRSDFGEIANAEGGDGSDIGAFELSASRSALLNIATRAHVQQNEDALIGGFIISGGDEKRVLLRAIGPSLSSRGIEGALQDPTLELVQGDTLLASNNDWKQNQQAEVEATGIPPTHDTESAIVRTLAAGSYTAVVRGADNQTGVALIEAYDLNPSAGSTLANISTRAFVQTDENVLIGGVIVGPAGTIGTRVMVRAIGPSLTDSGVADPLQDPTLELVDSNGSSVATNDNWKQTQESEIAATGISPSDDREAAIVQPLAAGNYTAVVRGRNNETGVALVEVYNLP